MSGDLVVNIVLFGILIIIAAFVISSLWFVLTSNKNKKSKHS